MLSMSATLSVRTCFRMERTLWNGKTALNFGLENSIISSHVEQKSSFSIDGADKIYFSLEYNDSLQDLSLEYNPLVTIINNHRITDIDREFNLYGTDKPTI